MTSIFLFTRDLRLEDNLALFEALKQASNVIPVFIFDNKQIGKKNDYRSINSIRFMHQSVSELNEACAKKLNVFYGNSKTILQRIRKQYNVEKSYVSLDYTPFSKARAKECDLEEVENVLVCPGDIKTTTGNVYTVFTPFYRNAQRTKVAPVQSFKKEWLNKFQKVTDDGLKPFDEIAPYNPDVIPGGRSNGLRILRNLSKSVGSYADSRNDPNIETSRLSAHHKFGTVSVRETYWAAVRQLKGKHKEGFVRQLYWRDFYYRISEAFPRIYKGAFKEEYNGLKWSKSKKAFELWCKGETGFPIVDAGMRQLNTTGWMHNRLRMIVASFLTKDLLINWKWGEKYFAQMLVDYDPAQNNGGWQWAASTGTDAQPYFRIFNPWTQSKRFDPKGTYIKKYVPELSEYDAADLHKPGKCAHDNYPKPMVDHGEQRLKALALFKL